MVVLPSDTRFYPNMLRIDRRTCENAVLVGFCRCCLFAKYASYMCCVSSIQRLLYYIWPVPPRSDTVQSFITIVVAIHIQKEWIISHC
mmetsp:Transcript_8900/g.13069  ORF Transcript_8900/g.13069 Transcript_8900/m.13069 type:complete len:88 (+) Transcript_8900:147-410(+)